MHGKNYTFCPLNAGRVCYVRRTHACLVIEPLHVSLYYLNVTDFFVVVDGDKIL